MENKEELKGKIHSYETFGLVDGPGVRYVVFLQGCHMRCKFCHNPETWSTEVGELVTPQELFNKVIRYKNYWGKNANGQIDGGVTVSGGEPLLQLEFVTEFFKLLKTKGVHTTIDTAGNPFTMEEPWLGQFRKLMEVTDLFMLDIKEMDPEKHKELTKWTNENILQMAKFLSDNGKEMWIRHVLVPGVTDDEDSLVQLREFLATLKTVSRTEILPYHTLGLFKWKNLNIPYPLEGVPTPTQEEVERAEQLLGLKSENYRENAAPDILLERC